MKSSAFYAKASVFSVLLVVESYFLTHTLLNFIRSQNFLTPSPEFMVSVILLQLALLITNALLAGAWDKWEQYLFAPIPIALAVFLVTFPVNSAYASLLTVIIVLIISYDLFLANKLKNQMLVFNPRLILKFSSKGILLSFSIAAALLVIISSGKQPKLNVGEEVGEIVDKYLTPQINTQLNTEFEKIQDPSLNQLQDYDILENLGQIAAPQLSLKDSIAQEVNKLLKPYRRFVNPVMAILVFGLIQFLGVIAFFLYSLVIDMIFWAAKKVGLIKVEEIPAVQQIIHF